MTAAIEQAFTRQGEQIERAFKEDERRRARERLEAYRALVVSLARGEGSTPDRAAAALHSAGKTPPELQEDVKRLRKRLDLKAAMESLPAATTRAEEAKAAVVAERERFEALWTEHLQRLRPLEEAAGRATSEYLKASVARSHLIGAVCPALREAMMLPGRAVGKTKEADLVAAALDPVEGLFWSDI